jgi:hypothetical protein
MAACSTRTIAPEQGELLRCQYGVHFLWQPFFLQPSTGEDRLSDLCCVLYAIRRHMVMHRNMHACYDFMIIMISSGQRQALLCMQVQLHIDLESRDERSFTSSSKQIT